jgi:hypothetical protein
MRSTAAKRLLAEIDTLAYPDRMRLLAARAPGRESRGRASDEFGCPPTVYPTRQSTTE